MVHILKQLFLKTEIEKLSSGLPLLSDQTDYLPNCAQSNSLRRVRQSTSHQFSVPRLVWTSRLFEVVLASKLSFSRYVLFINLSALNYSSYNVKAGMGVCWLRTK